MPNTQPHEEVVEIAKLELSKEEQHFLEETEPARLLGMFQALDFQAQQSRVMKALILKKCRDHKLYQRKGISSFERLCELMGINHRSALEEIKTIEDLGPQLMMRAERLNLPRETVRQLRKLQEPTLREVETSLKDESLTLEESRRMIRQVLNYAGDEHGRAQETDLQVRRLKEELDKRKESGRLAHEKLSKTETELERLKRGDAKSEKYWKLYTRTARSLADLAAFIDSDELPIEDMDRFKIDFQQLHSALDHLWRAFIAPPDGASKKEHEAFLRKSRGMSQEEAEEIASEMEN